jgi:hypothetical protein
MKRIFTHPVRTKKYQAPKLKKYGKVKNLTMSGSKGPMGCDNNEDGSVDGECENT